MFFSRIKNRKRLKHIYIRGEENKIQKKIEELMFKIKKNQLERDLLHSMMMLKNLAIVYEETPLSTDYILEELAKNGGKLKNVYLEMLSLYRNGNDEEAFGTLYEKLPIKTAKSFSHILSKIDRINPSRLIDYIDALLKSVSEKRMTDGIKRAERKSFAITAFACVSVFAVMLDFTVVTVFMNAMDMINSVFY